MKKKKLISKPPDLIFKFKDIVLDPREISSKWENDKRRNIIVPDEKYIPEEIEESLGFSFQHIFFRQLPELLDKQNQEELRRKFDIVTISIPEQDKKALTDFTVGRLDKIINDPGNYRILANAKAFKTSIQMTKVQIQEIVLIAYIMAKIELGYLPKRLTDSIIEDIQKEIKTTFSLAGIRKARSNHSDKREMKQYLSKLIQTNNLSGFDVLATMPDGNRIIQHITDKWK